MSNIRRLILRHVLMDPKWDKINITNSFSIVGGKMCKNAEKKLQFFDKEHLNFLQVTLSEPCRRC